MLALPAQSFKPPFAFLLLRKLILHEITIALSTFTCIVALVPSPLPFFPSLFVLDHQPGKVF